MRHLAPFALCLNTLASIGLAEPADLLVYEMEGYQDQEYYFSYYKKHLRSPNFQMFDDGHQAFSRLLDGLDVDVVHVCSEYLTKYIDYDLIEPWDPSLAERLGFGNIEIEVPPTVLATEQYLVPAVFGRTLPVYNSALVPTGDMQSLDVFLNPDYAGQVSIPSDPIGLLSLGLLATGSSDILTVTERQFQLAMDWIRLADANEPIYWSDYEELARMLGSGKVLISWTWSETGYLARQLDRSISFANNPVEGTAAWVCGYAKTKKSNSNLELIYDFANARSSPENIDILLRWGEGFPDVDVLHAHLSEDEIISRGLQMPDGPVMFMFPMESALLKKAIDEIGKITNDS